MVWHIILDKKGATEVGGRNSHIPPISPSPPYFISLHLSAGTL